MSNFSIEKKGYSITEVDAYIDDLVAKYTHLQSQNAELEQKLATAKRLIRRFSDTENALKQNIADSKRAAAYMISDAKERSSTLLDETRESCGDIISDLDMQISERMNTINLMKAEVAAFKDELFSLYSSHIELIDTLASSAENFEYQPDYTPVADAVDRFEENGEPDCEAPEFIEYPEESIFEEIKEAPASDEEFSIESTEVAEEAPADDSFNQLSIDTTEGNAAPKEDGDEFDMSVEEFEAVEEVDIDAVFSDIEENTVDETTAKDEAADEDKEDDVESYFKFLSDFANSEDGSEN